MNRDELCRERYAAMCEKTDELTEELESLDRRYRYVRDVVHRQEIILRAILAETSIADRPELLAILKDLALHTDRDL